MSRSSDMPSTRSAPACRHSASKTCREPASDPVCELAARAPASVSPPLRITVGFTRAQRRSASANAGPSETPSM